MLTSRKTNSKKTRQIKETFFLYLFLSSVIIGILALAVLLIDGLIDGLPYLNWDFLFVAEILEFLIWIK